jgi:hypothetical protein
LVGTAYRSLGRRRAPNNYTHGCHRSPVRVPFVAKPESKDHAAHQSQSKGELYVPDEVLRQEEETMAKEGTSGRKIRQDPRLARLLAEGTGNVTILRGFAGPSERDGYIRLFPSLADLSRSVEIAEADIIDSADVPHNDLGKIMVWVKRDSKVTFNQSNTSDYGPGVGRRPERRVGLTEQRTGRLRMQVRTAREDPDDTCVCICSCGTCTCNCTNTCIVPYPLPE